MVLQHGSVRLSYRYTTFSYSLQIRMTAVLEYNKSESVGENDTSRWSFGHCRVLVTCLILAFSY